MKLPPEIIEIIRTWNGFEDFNGNDVEVISKDPEIFSDCEVTLLMKAIEEENLEIIKALCEVGVDVKRVAKGTDQVPLTCFKEDSIYSFEISKILIDSGADVNYYVKIDDFMFEEMEFFISPLTKSCTIGNYNHVKLLIDSGVDLNFSISPKGFAAFCSLNPKSDDYLNILELFIENGVNVNADFGQPLIIALESGNLKAIELLLNAGAEPNISSKRKIDNGKTAIMTLLNGDCEGLTRKEEEELFEIFLKKIENINEQDTEGRTILFYAINTLIGVNTFLTVESEKFDIKCSEQFDIECFDTILSHKDIDINIIDNTGNNILTELLLKIEDDGITDENYFDNTERQQIYKLLQMNINTKVINNEGLTPLKIVKRIANKEMCSMFSQHLIDKFKFKE